MVKRAEQKASFATALLILPTLSHGAFSSTPRCSSQSCEDLKWTSGFGMSGTEGTCSERDIEGLGCSGFLNWKQASKFCVGVGGRFCTILEIETGQGQGKGCGYNGKPSWTSDSGSSPGTRMASTGEENGSSPAADADAFVVTCCADSEASLEACAVHKNGQQLADSGGKDVASKDDGRGNGGGLKKEGREEEQKEDDENGVKEKEVDNAVENENGVKDEETESMQESSESDAASPVPAPTLASIQTSPRPTSLLARLPPSLLAHGIALPASLRPKPTLPPGFSTGAPPAAYTPPPVSEEQQQRPPPPPGFDHTTTGNNRNGEGHAAARRQPPQPSHPLVASILYNLGWVLGAFVLFAGLILCWRTMCRRNSKEGGGRYDPDFDYDPANDPLPRFDSDDEDDEIDGDGRDSGDGDSGSRDGRLGPGVEMRELPSSSPPKSHKKRPPPPRSFILVAAGGGLDGENGSVAESAEFLGQNSYNEEENDNDDDLNSQML
mmetsp:Transcript_32920/g.67286  ORF Transcript_32920/g.67286 Transcript_32920/m.67286 type:complete len:495 (-) Transcript_32920:84-1568(-)